jgi:hypothetical protein
MHDVIMEWKHDMENIWTLEMDSQNKSYYNTGHVRLPVIF